MWLAHASKARDPWQARLTRRDAILAEEMKAAGVCHSLLGQTGGGMRSWWRNLHGDDSLDDKHLREMAGTFSRRLHAFCAKQGIPIIAARSARCTSESEE